MSVGIKCFSPATISNFNCIQNCAAVALKKIGVEVIVSRGTISEGEVIITGKYLDKNEKAYLKSIANGLISKFSSEYNIKKEPLKIKFQTSLSSNFDLGLYEATSVGIIWSLVEFYNLEISKGAIFQFLLKQKIKDLSPAQLAASLFGGFQLITKENNLLSNYRIPCPPGLYFTTISFLGNTINSNNASAINRDLLSKTAAFVLGMSSTNLDLIKHSLEDMETIQKIKSKFSNFPNLKTLNVSRETLGIGITENTSTLYFLSANSLHAENIALELENYIKTEKIKYITVISSIDHEGVYIC